MTRTDLFSGISEFLAVAEHSSFRAAAARLKVTPSAVSQAVRALEARIGLPLFLRTTRTTALTDSGAALLARLRPAAADIGDALDDLIKTRSNPAGHLRLSVPRIAMELAIFPVLPAFRKTYPDVTVEIAVDDASVDLAAGRFDGGIRIGEFVERDMVAVRLTPDFKWTIVGSPAYFAARGKPRTPQDLVGHECIGYRFPTAQSVYRWEFTHGGRAFSVDAPGAVIVNDHLSMVALAKRGVGLAYTADLVAAPELSAGTLLPVLKPYLPSKPGLFLYFPAKSQQQPKLRAFIDTARRVLHARRR